MSTHLKAERLGINRRWLSTERWLKDKPIELTVCGRAAMHCELALDGKLPTCRICLARGGKGLEGRS